MRGLIARRNSDFKTIKIVAVVIGIGLLLLMGFDLSLDYLAVVIISGSYLTNMGLFPWKTIQSLRPLRVHRPGAWLTWSLVLGLFVAFALGVYINMNYKVGIPLLLKLSFWGVIQVLCFLDGVKDAWAAAIGDEPRPSSFL